MGILSKLSLTHLLYGLAGFSVMGFILHYNGLRSDRADLRKTVTEMSQDIAGLKEQALEDAGRITALAASRDELDRLYQDQQAQSQRELHRFKTGMRNLRNALENLKTQPVSDGTLGPDVTALLYEQRAAAAADLAARARRLGSSGSDNLQAGPAPDDSTGIATGEPRDIAGPERTDADTDSRVDGGEPELGQARLGLDDGLAGSMAGTFAVPDGGVTVHSIRCILSDETDKSISVERADGTFATHTVDRSVKASDGTLVKWQGNWLTAWHIVDGPCIRILIDNAPWDGEVIPLADIDVAVLQWAGPADCRRPVTGELTFKGFHLVGGGADAGVYDFDTWSGPVLAEQQVGDPVPVAFQGVLVKSNSGGAVIDGDGALVGIAVEQSVDFDGSPLPVGWFTPMSEICKAMETPT